jgi:hypothetical protein
VSLRLRILAWIHVAIGGVGCGLFATLVATYVLARDAAYDDEFAWIGGLLGLATLGWFLPMLVGGVGLLKRWPWARALIWAVAGMLAVAVPVGTLLAGFSLWVLLTTREVSVDGGMAKLEDFVRRIVPLLIAALAALFILGLIILAGYLFRDVIDPPREQMLTPLPSGVPPQLPERPEFRMPDPKEFGLPRAPEQ